MLLQLDPLDHHFDPEGQAPTLWVSIYRSNNVANAPLGGLIQKGRVAPCRRHGRRLRPPPRA